MQRSVKARYPDHVWHIDLTVVPTLAGFWVPWLCQARPPSWPFGWHLLVVLDHFSRVVVGFEVFAHEPSAGDVCAALDRLVTQSQAPPKYIVTDRGAQFQGDYRAWCTRHGVRPRVGAVGQHGSIAVLERFIRTLKSEGLRRVLTPLTSSAMHTEVNVFCRWYGQHRPPSSLRGATPKEMHDGRRPARKRPRLEPRARYPIGGTLRGKRGDRIEVQVTPLEGREHLPVVRLRRLHRRGAA